ncbi:hypothetical protein AB0H42_07920 [Nocardia sp. NPDC050799]|uniref:hypothetical protein n=1 Tax=Nocardia sp. NPDC050799 TaxID=3154842 RepID=UPI00340E2AA9
MERPFVEDLIEQFAVVVGELRVPDGSGAVSGMTPGFVEVPFGHQIGVDYLFEPDVLVEVEAFAVLD